VSDKYKFELTDKIFAGFVESEILDFKSLPIHIQKMLLKTFHAGMITTFNHAEPLMESLMIGKNAEILGKAKTGENPMRFVVMQCDSEMEAKKTASDFDLYQEANAEYQKLIQETRDFAKAEMKASQKNSPTRQAEKKDKSNVFDFKHSAPKTTQ